MLAPFKLCPRGLSQGGVVLDEIDTCIIHCFKHLMADLALLELLCKQYFFHQPFIHLVLTFPFLCLTKAYEFP